MRHTVARRHDGGRRGGLRRTVGVAHLQARKNFGEAADGRLRHRRTAVDAEPPRPQIEAAQVRLQQAQAIHGRHHQRVGDLFLLRELQEFAPLEFGQRGDGAAQRQQGQHRAAQAGHVGPGNAKHRALSLAHLVDLAPVKARVHRIEVREHRALGLAGSARGVQDAEGVLFGDHRPHRQVGRMGREQLRPACGSESEAKPGGRTAGGQLSRKLGPMQQRHRLAVLEDVANLGALQPGADGHHYGAEHGDRSNGLDGLESVRRHQRHTVALLHAEAGQVGGDRFGLDTQLLVAHAHRGGDHCDAICGACKTRAQHLGDVSGALDVAADEAAGLVFDPGGLHQVLLRRTAALGFTVSALA